MTQVMALCALCLLAPPKCELVPHRVVDADFHSTTSSPCSSLCRAETAWEAEAPLILLCSMSIWKGLAMLCLHPYPAPGIILRFSERQNWPCHTKPARSSCSED